MRNNILKNMSYIFSGTILGSLLGICNTVLLVQAIGMEKNGIIFMGLSYAEFFNALFNFQSYEAVIKFLPGKMSYGDDEGKNIIQQAVILDVITAVFAFAVGYLCVDISATYFDWNIEITKHIKILTLTILFTLTGAFTGILRIFEKFNYIAIINIGGSLITTVLYLAGYILKLEFNFYVYAALITVIFNMSLTLYFTYKTLQKNGMEKLNFFKTKYDYEFIRFNIYTNLSSTLDLPIFHITPFIINKYLGFSEIAVYKILEKIGQIIIKVTSAIGQVLMPEISKRLSRGEKKAAYNMGMKLGKVILAIGLLGFIFVGLSYKYWLHYFIPEYSDYLTSVFLYFFLIIFTQSFMAQHPIFIYSGYVKENTVLLVVINLIYIFILFYMVKLFGIAGIIISRIIQASMVFTTKGIILKIKNLNTEKNLL